MKPDRIANIVLAVLVLLLAVLYFSQKEKPLPPQEPREVHHTNTVERWHTNTVERWQTNTLELWRTNTVVDRVTTEVTKEVPAKISEAVQSAAALGYKFGHAPSLTARSDALYRATPLAADVVMNDSARALLPRAYGDVLKNRIADSLRTRGIATADNSPCRLRLSISTLWATDVPRILLLQFRLELVEDVFLVRQADVLKCPASVWSIATLKTPAADALAEEVTFCAQGQIDTFCADYLQAREHEKQIQARLPAIPADFLSTSH